VHGAAAGDQIVLANGIAGHNLDEPADALERPLGDHHAADDRPGIRSLRPAPARPYPHPGRKAEPMTTSLNKHSQEFAQDQIKQGHVVLDQRDDWSEHQLSTKAENEFIEARGWDEYANWHLGVDDEASEHTKARYKFPYGDFERVHRCGLNAAEVRAARQKYLDIEDAAVRLREMMDKQDR
jgi:hypothetical protein